MKNTLLILSLAALAATGCKEHKEVRATPPAPKPTASAAKPAEAPAPAADAAPPPPVAISTIKAEPVAQELTPIQEAIEQFKTQHGRLPFDVQELLAMKGIASLPALPPGKIYVIDKTLGVIRVMSGP